MTNFKEKISFRTVRNQQFIGSSIIFTVIMVIFIPAILFICAFQEKLHVSVLFSPIFAILMLIFLHIIRYMNRDFDKKSIEGPEKLSSLRRNFVVFSIIIFLFGFFGVLLELQFKWNEKNYDVIELSFVGFSVLGGAFISVLQAIRRHAPAPGKRSVSDLRV